MNYRQAHQQMQQDSHAFISARNHARIVAQPGKGYRVNFWRRMARAILRAFT